MTQIDIDFFNEIRKNVPIICVDLVIPKNDKILLIKRGESPAKGQWWTPGGRIFHGETIEDACVRKAQEEVQVDCMFKKVLGVTETIFDREIINGDIMTIHTVNIVGLMKLKDDTQHIQVDKNHSSYSWRGEPFEGLHPAMIKNFELFANSL